MTSAVLAAAGAYPEDDDRLGAAPRDLFAAIPSLALGGAERIVLDWAARNAKRHRIHLLVTGRAAMEWSAPDGVRVLRADGADANTLAAFGREAARASSRVIAHMLLANERAAIAKGGALVVPVVHNAPEGWREPADRLADAPFVIAVSDAVAQALVGAGVDRPISVIRHLPSVPRRSAALAQSQREAWRLPADALVVGMIGGVKPQKAYPRAVRILAALLERRDAYLVVLGGPVGRDGETAMAALRAQVERLRLGPFVRLAGFIPDASRFLSAFDVVLNTSLYEGLSIASLEALAAGLPVVASAVGGQGEVSAPGLRLLEPDAPTAEWVDAIEAAAGSAPPLPSWAEFGAHRLWSLAAMTPDPGIGTHVVFVTANLNVGGAQRSLVNLCVALVDRVSCEVIVTGRSEWSGFTHALRDRGVRLSGPVSGPSVFDQAEAILARLADSRATTVCFWNTDARLKLLIAKFAGAGRLRVVDVSPGADMVEELRSARRFGEMVAWPVDRYAQRLDAAVVKHRVYGQEHGHNSRVIPNGVTAPRETKRDYSLGDKPRIVVSGRIVPAKFVREIVSAMRWVWTARPDAELHVHGSFDSRHAEYGEAVRRDAADVLGERVFFHGASVDVRERVAAYDLFVVLGRNQGCPNALLEALAAGLPCIANDSGGTREQIRHLRTGWLLEGVDPRPLADAILALLADRSLAERLGRAGQRHVLGRFSMDAMTAAYERLFTRDLAPCV